MIAWLHDRNLSHPLIATAVFLVLAAAGWPTLGAVAPVAVYYGREQRDAEIATRTAATAGWRLALPWRWPRAQQVDFWPVLAVCCVGRLLWSLT